MASLAETQTSLADALGEWEAGWQHLHAETGTDALYHYTDAQGLLGIVRSGQLWASNAAFLNDSTEMTYIRDVLPKVAGQLRREHGVKAESREYARDVLAGTRRFSEVEVRTASVIGMLEGTPDMASGLYDVYVSCFCAHGDLLSQWRGYPPSGGGYASALRPESVRRGPGMLRRVIYDEEQRQQLLHGLLAPVARAVVSIDPERGNDLRDWLLAEHIARVARSIEECRFCFKHPRFAEESEWRLIILKGRSPDEPPPDLRATPTGLLPYLTRPLAYDAITGAVIGPNAHPALAADAAAHLMAKAGHENAREIVTQSAIPLRVRARRRASCPNCHFRSIRQPN